MSDTPTPLSPPAVPPTIPAATPATTELPAATPVAAAATPAPLELIDIEQFAKVKLCIAKIEAAEKVEKSKKLYKLQVDCGDLGKRQIISGIAQFYTPEQLIGRKIVIVANLKPAQLMGIESQGMLLAASTADRTALTLLAPGEDIAPGSFIS